ncbi:MAG: hypothetical protein E4G94_09505 [ANME-2 cluster archaeon]|nr:MAG: hypothetical protein E4G94_09505 [ANME-2 cluster archaeon]
MWNKLFVWTGILSMYCKEDQRTIEQNIETVLYTSQRMVQGLFEGSCYHELVGGGWVEKYIFTQD